MVFNIYRKVAFQMKITTTFLLLLALLLPNTFAHKPTKWSLPEGAVARLGKGSIEEILYSPDGTRLAVISSVGTWFYDTETYREIALLPGSTHSSDGVSFSPDSRTLATADGGKTVWLWDTETGEQKSTLSGHKSAVTSVSFSPDSRTLASGSWDNTVRLWDTETGEHKGTLSGHTEDIISVAFSSDGTIVAGGGWDGVRLWDALTLEPNGALTGWTPKLDYVAFSPDGKVFVVKQQGIEFSVWDTETWGNEA